MEEFIKNFNEFKEFLNSPVTEYTIKTLAGKDAETVLKVIRDKFDELGLNEAF